MQTSKLINYADRYYRSSKGPARITLLRVRVIIAICVPRNPATVTRWNGGLLGQSWAFNAS